MTTATAFTNIPTTSGKSSGGNWFNRFISAIAKGQELRARRMVCDHFRMMDTRTLQTYGFSAKDIERLRRGEIVPFPG